jgi:hypothetical protein
LLHWQSLFASFGGALRAVRYAEEIHPIGELLTEYVTSFFPDRAA